MATSPNTPALVFPLADLGLCELQPYTQNAEGKWTAVDVSAYPGGSANGISLLGYLDSVVVAVSQELMQAISVDSAYMNRIPTIIDSMAVVTENLKRPQSATDRATTTLIVANYALVRLRFAFKKKATGTGAPYYDLITLYGAWSRYNGGVQGTGVQKGGMTIEQVDTSYTLVNGDTGVVPFSITRLNTA